MSAVTGLAVALWALAFVVVAFLPVVVALLYAHGERERHRDATEEGSL